MVFAMNQSNHIRIGLIASIFIYLFIMISVTLHMDTRTDTHTPTIIKIDISSNTLYKNQFNIKSLLTTFLEYWQTVLRINSPFCRLMLIDWHDGVDVRYYVMKENLILSVSYTHLTLPTICSV